MAAVVGSDFAVSPRRSVTARRGLVSRGPPDSRRSERPARLVFLPAAVDKGIVRLVDSGWRDELISGVTLDRSRLRIVCPFVKEAVVAELLERGPERVELVTRFSLADFGAGVSDIAALRRVLQAGGQVRGIRGLHAKVYVFGAARAAVTSANLTAAGLSHNREFGCVTDDPGFLADCDRYVDDLWDAGALTNLAQLDEWEEQVEVFLTGGGRPSAAAALPDFGADVPAGGARAPGPSPDRMPGWSPGWAAESGEAFVKFFGEGDNRAYRDASVLDEVRRSGCHWACTYPAARRPREVRDGDTLFVGRLARDPADTLIFGRVIGRQHVDGRDEASAEEIARRTWKASWPNYVRVHHGEFLAGDISNGLSLDEMMSELGPHSFEVTQRHLAEGSGNVNPRRAFLQKPAVRLSQEGHEWMRGRLDRAFAVHGRLPQADLDQLDWPRPL